MTDRKKVDIAIFECSEENEVENLRQVVICPPFQKVGKEGRHQDPRRRTRKDNQRLNADCDGVCDLVLRSDSKSGYTSEGKFSAATNLATENVIFSRTIGFRESAINGEAF